jgi:phosphatidylglycerol---prolipoprotein diacylglyceryl transferase
VIPYFEIPPFGPYGLIHAFGVLVATGILLGAWAVRKRARQIGLDDLDASSMTTWAIVVGFIISHLFDVIFYQPDTLAKYWREIFSPPAGSSTGPALLDFVKFLLIPLYGISSMGGFLGALIAMLYWCWSRKKPLWPFADSAIFGLMQGWLFGRLGCFSAHDHPGRHTDFFLAVRYPDGPRHDLGLYEAIYAGLFTAIFWALYRKPRRVGTYLAITCLTYAPLRFLLDFLRATDVQHADPRYFGFTPAQYTNAAVLVAGIVIARRAWRSPTTMPLPASPAPENGTSPTRPGGPIKSARKRPGQKQSERG